MDSADRDRKKAWKARERENARSAFPLPNDLLESMFKAVETLVEENGYDHSHHFTAQWLSENQLSAKKVIGWLEAHGGFCDCEGSANAYDPLDAEQVKGTLATGWEMDRATCAGVGSTA